MVCQLDIYYLGCKSQPARIRKQQKPKRLKQLMIEPLCTASTYLKLKSEQVKNWDGKTSSRPNEGDRIEDLAKVDNKNV
jgi:hypothetical protein